MLKLKYFFCLLLVLNFIGCQSLFNAQPKQSLVVLVRGQGVDLLFANGAPLNYQTTDAVVLPTGRTEIEFRWPKNNSGSTQTKEFKLIFSTTSGYEYLITSTTGRSKPCIWTVDQTGKFLDFNNPIACVANN